jgi:Fungal Zn(2)-Cys(6) binuclear cluster domain
MGSPSSGGRRRQALDRTKLLDWINNSQPASASNRNLPKEYLNRHYLVSALHETCLRLYTQLWQKCQHRPTLSPDRRARTREYLGSLLLWGEMLARNGLRGCLDGLPNISSALIEVLCNIGKTLIRSMYEDLCVPDIVLSRPPLGTEVWSVGTSVTADIAAIKAAAWVIKGLLLEARLLQSSTEIDESSDVEQYSSEEEGLSADEAIQMEDRGQFPGPILVPCHERTPDPQSPLQPSTDHVQPFSANPSSSSAYPLNSPDQHQLRPYTAVQSGKPCRAAQACDTCRKREIICDEGRPECQLCKSHALKCFYADLSLQKQGSQSQTTVQNLDTMTPSSASSAMPNLLPVPSNSGRTGRQTGCPALLPLYKFGGSRFCRDMASHIACLQDLAPTLEQMLAGVDQIYKMRDDGARPVFHVSDPARPFVLQIHDRYRSAPTYLVERLGEANWQRWVRIRKQMDGEGESEEGNEEQEIAHSTFFPVSKFHDSGLGTSIPAQPDRAFSIASHTSFLSSHADSEDGKARVPPTPEQVAEGRPFECSICGQNLANIKNRIDWK